ncbi:UAA transporter [Mycena floridula]|nr:UAA transporter [Mycena floridula]
MVLGGCCANVLAYEQLLMLNPRIGSALTFCQMLFITTRYLPSFLSFTPSPRLKPRQVPLHRWAVQVIVITAGSLLNNWAFAFNVPFTVLIVFRSAGLSVSMLFGFIFLKRRYTFIQVTSVLIVSAGVVVATLARPSVSSTTSSSPADISKYTIGIMMLVVSLFLTATLGLIQENTYKKYGPCWQEGVFYTHFLSLPIFLFLTSDIKQGISSLSNSSDSSPLVTWLILGSNLVSQLVCVSGVNRLTSRVSSVSTNLVLTARKALSLCFSVWWSGSQWNFQLVVGAVMVFLGSVMFSQGAEKVQKGESKKDK